MRESGDQKDNRVIENIPKKPKELGKIDLKETHIKLMLRH